MPARHSHVQRGEAVLRACFDGRTSLQQDICSLAMAEPDRKVAANTGTSGSVGGRATAREKKGEGGRGREG